MSATKLEVLYEALAKLTAEASVNTPRQSGLALRMLAIQEAIRSELESQGRSQMP